MRRDPRPFQRCQQCSRRAGGRRCVHCGSDRVAWAFIVDLNEPGAPRRQAWRSGYPTKEAALADLRKLMAAAESGRTEPTKMTTGQWLAEWLPSVKGRVRASTWANYELIVRLRLVRALGSIPLRQLRSAHIEAVYADLSQHLSPKSVHNTHLCLRVALEAAVRNDLIQSNPAARGHRSPSRPEMQVWDAEQAGRFLRATADDPLYALWRLAVLTGARRGELLGLQWPDIDLDRGFISIQRTLSRQGSRGVVLSEPKTPRSRRRVPIDRDTASALREHRGRQVVVPTSGLIFTRWDGSPLDPDTVTTAFRTAARTAGLPRIRLHDLRHTAATLMLRSGEHPKVVQERLGHASVAVTLDLYSHAVPSMGIEAADRLAALVDG
jgi:integrase